MQLSVLSLYALAGEILIESMVGGVLSMVTEVEDVSVPPYPSVTEAVQVMLSEGWVEAVLSVKRDPVPKKVLPMLLKRLGDRKF